MPSPPPYSVCFEREKRKTSPQEVGEGRFIIFGKILFELEIGVFNVEHGDSNGDSKTFLRVSKISTHDMRQKQRLKLYEFAKK